LIFVLKNRYRQFSPYIEKAPTARNTPTGCNSP